MGRIRIRDDSDERTIETREWDGDVELHLREAEDVEVVVSPDSPFASEDVDVSERPVPNAVVDDASRRHWVLTAPTVLGTVVLGAVETGLVASVIPSLAGAVSLALYWTFVLTAVIGTVCLYRDARSLADRDAAWQPDPLPYIVGGGTVVAAITAWIVGVPAGSVADVGGALAGMGLVGCAVSAAVAGPVYLYRRRLKLGP